MFCFRSFIVWITLCILSTKMHPPRLSLPKLFLRHITAGRSIRSARLLVGSRPGIFAQFHIAGSRFSRARHIPEVLRMPNAAPYLSTLCIFCRSGSTFACNCERPILPLANSRQSSKT